MAFSEARRISLAKVNCGISTPISLFTVFIGIVSSQHLHVLDPEFAPPLQLRTTEAFFLSIDEGVFNNSQFVEHGRIKYRPSLLSMPDLPKWMSYMYSNYYRDGFIYGVPEKAEDITIEVIATNETFFTKRRLVKFYIKDRMHNDTADFEVQLKFSNLNVEDMFFNDRLNRLLDIFKQRLWRGAHGLYVTFVESAVKFGGRRPPNPKEKDGVVVRIGAKDDFTRELQNLEREVSLIRNREVCPKDYLRTSAERFFRDEDFIPDWCGFRLLADGKPSHNNRKPTFSPILFTNNEYKPPAIEEMVSRDLLADFLLCIILPTALTFILAALLSMIMFGRREGVEKRNRETPSVQMVQYASVHRASNNLRTLTTKRDGPTPSATTPSSTLPRSYANSPTNTLSKGNTSFSRKMEDKSMNLIRMEPAPYGFPGHNLESPQKTVA